PSTSSDADRLAMRGACRRWRLACLTGSQTMRPMMPSPVRRIDNEGSAAVDRKRVVILLRAVVIATTAYLVLSGGDAVGLAPLLYVAAFAASDVALAFAPRTLFYMPHFGPCLLLADTAVILVGMTWSHGLSQDLLLAYFFIVFLIT